MLFVFVGHGETLTPADDSETLILVDAPNVMRSRWPNMPAGEIAPRTVAWARERGLRPVVVFDRRAPGGLVGEQPLEGGGILVGTGAESGDDRIARTAAELARAGTPYWLVTSDRGLRARAGAAAERTIGGGAFLRELEGVPFPPAEPGR
jgi:hypothetical protein